MVCELRSAHKLLVIQLSSRSTPAGSIAGAWAADVHRVVVGLLVAKLHAQQRSTLGFSLELCMLAQLVQVLCR